MPSFIDPVRGVLKQSRFSMDGSLKMSHGLQGPARQSADLSPVPLKRPGGGTDNQGMSEPAGFQLFKPMTYGQYLETPQWRATRAAALLRAGNRCALDGSHGEDLDVLHNTRERLGAELDSDLVVLCASCRELVRAALPCHSPAADEIPYPVVLRRVLTGAEMRPFAPVAGTGAAGTDAEIDTDSIRPAAAAGSPPWAHLRARRPRRTEPAPASA